MINVEYLLPFDTAGGICKNIKSFKSLLESNSNFSIREDKLIFKGSSYAFSVDQTDVDNQNCSVYHVTFGVGRNTEKFREMLKVFRKTVGLHLQDRIQIVWDGVSFEWSKELYPRIYQIENSMRKLISKFMLTKLGIGWHKSAIPKAVKESIKDSNYKPSHSILYEVDFIQLSNFLFKEYSLKDPLKLPDVLNNILQDGFDESKKEEILDYIPKNNWDRYFSNLVNIESDQLKKKWELLYETRIKVAHNKSMTLEEYEKARHLCDELDQTLSDALNNIDTIEIPEDDKESISLKTIGTMNEPTRYFTNEYLSLDRSISQQLNALSGEYDHFKSIENPLSAFLNQPNLNELGLNQNLYESLNSINLLKNDIISGDTFLTIDNPISPDLFKSTSESLISALEERSIDLDMLNTNLGIMAKGSSGKSDNTSVDAAEDTSEK